MVGDKFKLGPNREKRLTRTSLVIPICIGNVASTLPKKEQDGGATHDWKVYVRSPDNTDMSYCISKVSFTLHQSFAVANREHTNPPYEVHEQGWGEFDVQIKIEFSADAMESPIKLQHHLKLFPDDDRAGRKVVSETYDELVFWEPTDEFYTRIKNARIKGNLIEPPDTGLPVYSEQAELNNLLSSRHKVAEEKAKLLSKLR